MSGYVAEALERQAELLRLGEGTAGWRLAAEMADQGAAGGAWFALQMRRSLSEGETFYVTPPAGALLEAAAASVPDRPLAAADVPAPDGFCWFARPLWLPGATPDGACALRAVSWASAWRPGPAGQAEPGISVTWYVAPPERPDGAVPMTWVCCAFGAGRQEALDACEAIGAVRHGGRFSAKLRVVWALFGLLRSARVEAVETVPDRAARRRLVREGWTREPLVRVVRPAVAGCVPRAAS